MSGERVAARRRGRPRNSERRSDLEPREEILHHAARLFSAKGLGATRLADIADAVGVKAPAIYYYFANLDAIVSHLLDYVVDESTAFATRSAAAGGTSSERLWALVEHHVRRLAEGPYDLWFVAGMSDDDRARFPAVTATADRWRDVVTGLFEEGRDHGEFRAIDSRLVLAAVSGLVYGALELRHHAGDVDPGSVADLVVAALALPAPTRA